MSLSTIDMLNKLKAGELAICLEEQEYYYYVKIIDGSYYWLNIHGKKSEILSLSNNTLNYRWRIIQEYVHFSKAIVAFMNGKKIYSFDVNGEYCNEYDPEFDENGHIAISEILNCNWAVEI